MFNLAHSAPRGYDLRAPYNVPMGEIKVLRVVEPFSLSSYQQDTITTALPKTCLGPSYSVARIIRCKKRICKRKPKSPLPLQEPQRQKKIKIDVNDETKVRIKQTIVN